MYSGRPHVPRFVCGINPRNSLRTRNHNFTNPSATTNQASWEHDEMLLKAANLSSAERSCVMVTRGEKEVASYWVALGEAVSELSRLEVCMAVWACMCMVIYASMYAFHVWELWANLP